ncbi:MAG TPA: hypothetical protein VFI42_13515 [Thermomicrobiaceae bacterium]|jgi:hypothetical protein|nr:hypothetical protein [Thermomicrobiaceae bacterium]
MCAGHEPGGNHDHPSFGSLISNWTTYDAPFGVKVRLAVRNLWRRVILRQNCCGNHGQPGC